MKKCRIPALLLILASLFLPSCSGTQTQPAPSPDTVREGWTCLSSDDRVYGGSYRNFSDGIQSVGDYLYFDGGNGGYVVPARLNRTTGNVTYLCPDPLCSHDTAECPLYGTRHFIALDDGSILAERQYSVSEMTAAGLAIVERVHEVMRFEPETRRSTVLEELGAYGGSAPEVYCGNLRFFISQIYTDEGEWIGGLTRMDVTTGKTELLFKGSYMLLLEKDGRIWASDGVGIFSFEARSPSPVLREEFGGASAVFPEHAQYSTDGRNLYVAGYPGGTVRVFPLDGGEERSLTVGFAEHNVLLYTTENWLYYLSGETTVLGQAKIPGYASDRVELYGTEFRRCRPDGSEDRTVFRFEGEFASLRPLHTAADGRYLWCTYSWWEDPDGDGVYRDGGQQYSFPVNGHDNCFLLRIDCETGEAEIVVVREGTK